MPESLCSVHSRMTCTRLPSSPWSGKMEGNIGISSSNSACGYKGASRVGKGSPATFDMMSRRPSNPVVPSVPRPIPQRPRNRRLDADEVGVAEKVATCPSGRKTKGGSKGKSSAADRREERRLAREPTRGRAAAREEREARWAARTEWLGIQGSSRSSGCWLCPAGPSWSWRASAPSSRAKTSAPSPGHGTRRRQLPESGAPAPGGIHLHAGRLRIAAPLFGVWLVAAGAGQFAQAPQWALGACAHVLAAALVCPGPSDRSPAVRCGDRSGDGWGGDHLVGSVGLWLTQWSRFTLASSGPRCPSWPSPPSGASSILLSAPWSPSLLVRRSTSRRMWTRRKPTAPSTARELAEQEEEA